VQLTEVTRTWRAAEQFEGSLKLYLFDVSPSLWTTYSLRPSPQIGATLIDPPAMRNDE